MYFYVACIYIFITFLPGEIAFFIGSVRLEPYRIVLLFVMLGVCLKCFQRGSEKFEWFLHIAVFWAILSNFITMGVGGVEKSAMYFLEVWVGYHLGKYAIRSHADFIVIIRILLGLFLVLIPLGIYESQTGYRITHVWAGKITGVYGQPYLIGDYFRLGVNRSSTIFSHPILYGLCAASIFPFVFNQQRLIKGSVVYIWGLVVAVYVSMTSAAIIMIAFTVFLNVLEKISLKISSIKSIFIFSFLSLLVFLEFFSNQGAVKFLMTMAALNPGTAFMRYAQYDYSKDDIARNPVWGLTGDWTRPFWVPASVDNYWLVLAMDYGIPGFFFMACFWLVMISKLHKYRNAKPEKTIFFAFISMSALAFAGLTVHFFDRAHVIIYFLIGIYSGCLVNALGRKYG